MNDEITQGFDRTQRGMEMPPVPADVLSEAPSFQSQMLQRTAAAQGVVCAHCGTVNEPDSMYCSSCGQLLRMISCPHCGSSVEPDADFCEVCHHYISRDVCSFCGAKMSENEDFCHQCGMSRGGVVCPVCHALNEFSFCKQCGTPLTEEARILVQQLKMQPEYMELTNLAKEYDDLQMQLPYRSERDVQREKQCEELRMRVLQLLAHDEGETQPQIAPNPANRNTKEELEARKSQVANQIMRLLDRMAVQPQVSPAKARNFAMAQKPAGMRLAWKCNYKQALHSSPCGCAKPQLGGQWIILGHNSKQEIKDDK